MFQPIEITEGQARTFFKYAIPVIAFLILVFYVFSAAKRNKKY